MDTYDNEVDALRFMLDGNSGSARFSIRRMTQEELQKLSDALDYYAVLVDEQLICDAHQDRT